MGHYHLTVNLDKRQFLDPHRLGDGLKVAEQANSGEGGIGSALIVLLAVSNGRGGGDFEESEIVGSWGGDRIAIVGDYAKDQDLPAEYRASTIYEACRQGEYRDITKDVQAFMARELGLAYRGEPGTWMERTSI